MELKELLQTLCKYSSELTGRRIEFEYVRLKREIFTDESVLIIVNDRIVYKDTHSFTEGLESKEEKLYLRAISKMFCHGVMSAHRDIEKSLGSLPSGSQKDSTIDSFAYATKGDIEALNKRIKHIENPNNNSMNLIKGNRFPFSVPFIENLPSLYPSLWGQQRDILAKSELKAEIYAGLGGEIQIQWPYLGEILCFVFPCKLGSLILNSPTDIQFIPSKGTPIVFQIPDSLKEVLNP